MSETLRYPFPDIPAEGEAIEVAEGILWMRLPLPMKLDHVNIYALDDGDAWTIVDTGFHSKRGVAIWEKLLAGPLKGKPVGRVIVTHHHPDHIGMAGWFQEPGAELVTTRTAWLMARMLVLDEQDRPTPETLQFWTRAGMDPEILAERASERPFNFADCVVPLPLGYRRIREGDTLHAGGRDWTVRMGNGHAPEHATLWADDVVLGGDQLLPSISPNLGVYPTEPDADPVSDWLEACERLGVYATPEQLVLPGHKLPFTGLPLRMRQLIDNHHGALARLLEHLDMPKTAHECFLPLFKREIRGGEYGLALVESVAHCAHLYLAGQATRSLRDDGAYVYQRKGA
ncbi:MBL fold metallo-hydrolase [Litoreibacter arenae]|uniref:Metallo-beta-lactamase family protein n=1 Tax=Litoreibacter arenae DSM 19593 TaxID=1123360 RepID=S9RUP7_9RHOB|nr:MBL fold metallo-hydrolase [Litoreibacter arenae]EPX81775.1 Metallo-beta-lactamase family protein [Litoreibacter arenae DSM 19593]